MQAFIFDFDGTLADSEKCSILSTQSAFAKFGLNIPSEQQISYYMGIPIEKSFKEMSETILSEEDFEKLLILFREQYRLLENDTLTVFPSIPQILHTLKQMSINLFVVSSKKTDVLLRNLQALQIDAYFDDFIGSDKVTHYKPHPEGIFILRDQHQLNLTDCLMIGDAIFDIQMGKAASTNTCAVTWGSHTKEKLLFENPTYCIESPNELLTILKNDSSDLSDC